MMRWKIILLLFGVLLTFAFANAQINYIDCNLELRSNSVIADISLYLKAESAVNYFVISMPFYENGTVLSLADSLGEIKDYKIEENVLTIRTNSSAKRREDIIKLKVKIDGLAEERFSNIYFVKFSLPAEQKTKVSFRAYGKRILGFDTASGFRGSLKNGELKISGLGPFITSFFYSEEGRRFGKFILLNKSNLTDEKIGKSLERASELYFIVLAVLGIELDANEFAVLVLSDDEYKEKINEYSEGVYSTGGLIVIKESAFEKKEAPAVVLHELTHEINAKIMAWNNSGTSWFDEGLAKFVEYLTKKQLGLRTNNLFYGVVQYSDAQYTYTLNPASDWKLLKQYYDKNEQFMLEWNADNADIREFGYAFSELFIREYVKEKGFGALHRALRELLKIKQSVNTPKEFSKAVLEALDTKLEPCKRESEKKLLSCIRELNRFNPEIPETKVLIIGVEEQEVSKKPNMQALRKKLLEEKLNVFSEMLMQLLEALMRSTKSALG